MPRVPRDDCGERPATFWAPRCSTCRRYRPTLRSETTKPSFKSSPWISSAHSGFSSAKRRIRRRIASNASRDGNRCCARQRQSQALRLRGRRKSAPYSFNRRPAIMPIMPCFSTHWYPAPESPTSLDRHTDAIAKLCYIVPGTSFWRVTWTA
jgi:hypothetical protein